MEADMLLNLATALVLVGALMRAYGCYNKGKLPDAVLYLAVAAIALAILLGASAGVSVVAGPFSFSV